MADKPTCTFDMFLQDVHPDHLSFVLEVNALLRQKGYTVKVEQAKSGFVVSYNDPATKKVLMNYVFRKTGMQARLYLDHVAHYQSVLEAAPPKMAAKIDKASPCKRLLNPADCNSRCAMGYVFTMHGKDYQKCRYGCFLLPVTMENIPLMRTLIEKEAAAREAA